jgi:hypothetical protein
VWVSMSIASKAMRPPLQLASGTSHHVTVIGQCQHIKASHREVRLRNSEFIKDVYVVSGTGLCLDVVAVMVLAYSTLI